MTRVDEAVENLERLYTSFTGKPVPTGAGPYAPIPPEKDPVRHVLEQLDRLIEALRGPSQAAASFPWTPRAALWESDRELTIQVELAGVPRDGLEVSFVENVLTVKGSRPAPLVAGDRAAPRATEIPTGRFARAFLVPPGSGTKEIAAQLRDGMLEIRIPRMPSNGPGVQGQTIAVR
jgi:HSP20 family protein